MKEITTILYNYDQLIDTFECETLVQVETGDYQGDTFLLLKKGEKLGFLIFGWGSCSGCDALQSITTIQEAEELRDELYDNTVWGTKEEIVDHITSKDFKLEWYGHDKNWKKFIEQVHDHLEI